VGLVDPGHVLGPDRPIDVRVTAIG
jgi:hypothetical protein